MSEPLNVALALVRSEQGWLISRRSAGRIFASLWEFPGGKMKPGESPQQAAARETREETGLTVEPLELLGVLPTTHAQGQVILHLVRCRPLSGDPAPSDPAVEEVRWATLPELETLPMPPVNAQIIATIRTLESRAVKTEN